MDRKEFNKIFELYDKVMPRSSFPAALFRLCAHAIKRNTGRISSLAFHRTVAVHFESLLIVEYLRSHRPTSEPEEICGGDCPLSISIYQMHRRQTLIGIQRGRSVAQHNTAAV